MSATTGLDTRVVYGAKCGWWGMVREIGDLKTCPHCAGMLLVKPSVEDWWSGVDRFEATGNAGYRTFIEWLRGQHFPTYRAAAVEYERSVGHPSGYPGWFKARSVEAPPAQ